MKRKAINLLILAACGLVAGCGGSSGGADGGGGTGGGNPGAGSVTISGTASYEFPPPVPPCRGLDFANTGLRPIRAATIQIVDAASQAVLAETSTSDEGEYSLTVAADTDVFIRVRAELKRAGTPSWDVEVRDNVTEDGSVPLAARPLYVLDTAPVASGSGGAARDVVAATGWSGAGYTAPRAAAPFAVLDAVYSGMLIVLEANPDVRFEPLDVFWSPDNTPTAGEQIDPDTGEIGTSFYSTEKRMFLLGKAGLDTEEFDPHVIVHEWGHYFEDTLSRSDSIGGPHALGDELDMRVAFGEGWATAFAGMALASRDYCDTSGFASQGLFIDLENSPVFTSPGWYNELSVTRILYDLWDTEDDGADTGSLGFGPVFDVMTGPQAATAAFTSIYTFASALKEARPDDAALIDALLAAENITGSGPFGDGETNDAGAPEDVLPVYTRIFPDGSAAAICSNSLFDRVSGDLRADGNKLAEHRFLRMTVDTEARHTFDVRTTTTMAEDDPDDLRDQSDPDILIMRNGVPQNAFVDLDGDGDLELEGFSGAANAEIFTTAGPLVPGEYVLALVEFRYRDGESPADFPPRTCFEVSVAPAL